MQAPLPIPTSQSHVETTATIAFAQDHSAYSCTPVRNMPDPTLNILAPGVQLPSPVIHPSTNTRPWVFVQLALLLLDLRHGCNIVYTGPQFAHTTHNVQSSCTYVDPTILDNVLLSECTKGHMLDPFNAPPLPNLRYLGLGIVPKHDGTNSLPFISVFI